MLHCIIVVDAPSAQYILISCQSLSGNAIVHIVFNVTTLNRVRRAYNFSGYVHHIILKTPKNFAFEMSKFVELVI